MPWEAHERCMRCAWGPGRSLILCGGGGGGGRVRGGGGGEGIGMVTGWCERRTPLRLFWREAEPTENEDELVDDISTV